jgi:hypothetical protein
LRLIYNTVLVILVVGFFGINAQAQESNLYLNMFLFKGSREYKDYSRRYFEKDTVINSLSFKKYRWETFKKNTQVENVSYEYEYIERSKYILLDEKFIEVHSFNLDRSPQEGRIFYEKGTIVYELIKGYNFPQRKESEFDKYRLRDEEYSYVLFGINNDKVEMTSIEEKVSLLLEGESIDMICNILDDRAFDPDPPSFNVIGDKIQYEVWNTTVTFAISNDMPTKKTEESYGVKDLITQEYTGDTIINGKTYSKLYTVIKGMRKADEKSLNSFVNIKDNKLVLMNEGEEFEIEYSPSSFLTLDSNALIFRGSMNYAFSGKDFAKYISWSATGYETLLSFISVFPCPMIEMWGHDNKITYLKVDGVEYGELK